MAFRSPYQAPYSNQSRESWSEWQDLNPRPLPKGQRILERGPESPRSGPLHVRLSARSDDVRVGIVFFIAADQAR
jgi:hypothetical protein